MSGLFEGSVHVIGVVFSASALAPLFSARCVRHIGGNADDNASDDQALGMQDIAESLRQRGIKITKPASVASSVRS